MATTFPDASNTGVPQGTTLTRYVGTLHITTDNAVISNLEVFGDIIIDAKNVTIQNTKVISNTPWHAIRVMDDATGFTMMDSEIDGGGTTVNGVLGQGTFLRTDIHGVENGINITGPSLIQDNFIHSLAGGPDAHFDGIENNGASNVQILHNTIINDHGQTAAVMLNNEFGGLSNIRIDGNQLVGGGYTVYLDDRKGGGAVDDASISITNNQIGGGQWGDFALYGNQPVLYGNVGLGTLPGTGGGSAVTYTGTQGNDVLPLAGQSSDGNEIYKGLGGNDVLKGGAGADVLDGGADTDTASYAGSTAVNVNLETGTASGGHAAGDTFVSIENLTGSSNADTLRGNAGNNVLNGGSGADTMAGLQGNDTYIVADAGDVVTESAGGGTDLVRAGVSFALGANVENLTLTGSANVKGTGNTGANTIIGNSGSNILDGGPGADKLVGGTGNDTFVLGAENDAVSDSGGTDTVTSTVTRSLAGLTSIENLKLLGSGNISGTGNALKNTIAGNTGNNLLYGGAGDDVISGGAGNDTIDAQAGADRVTGGAGADKFVFRQSLVTTSGADHITDFDSSDFIYFDVSSGPTGALNPAAFRVGANALDANDRFMYDAPNKALYYDSDGNGGAAKVLLATFDNGYTPAAADFLLY
ncbi:calcium-binding protein [Ensifer sp. IC3342]|nr:calcium-binding protein [Ensifer sp. BRP08]MCA1446214.1 calcium-binding protein [Ensifer sp. IC3342]